MRLVDRAAGPFPLLKNKHLAQLLAAQHQALTWIQYDSPALMRLVDRAAGGRFLFSKTSTWPDCWLHSTWGQLYLENLLRWIQYDSPALMRLVDWAAGPFPLLKNEHLAQLLAAQQLGPILP